MVEEVWKVRLKFSSRMNYDIIAKKSYMGSNRQRKVIKWDMHV